VEKPRPTKAQTILLSVAPFPALVFFKFWATAGRDPSTLFLVGCAMLVYCLLVIGLAYRWDRPSYFDWAVGAYFLLASVSLAIWPEAAGKIFAGYGVTGIFLCLFVAAFFPPLLGLDPFTYHYAKKYTPKEVWGNPIFYTINRIMTYSWAGIFAVCGVLSLYPSVFTRAVIPVAFIVGFGLPFNLRFPNYYLRRLGLPSLAEQRRMALQKEGTEKVILPAQLPKSAWEAVSAMPGVFDGEAAGDLSAVIKFQVSGSEVFTAYLRIEEGNCSLEEEPPGNPDLIIESPAHVWLAISRKELDGQQAFAQQAFKAEGNLGILLSMSRLFSGAPTKNAKPIRSMETEPTTNSAAGPQTSRKEKGMKILALNSSPRGEGESKTELMLKHLVRGMQEAGAQVEVVHLRKKTVKNCIGCYTCWTKTPGVCVHKDDMTNELFPKWLESDLIIYATPLYNYTVNATMKAFMERLLPVLQPFIEQKEGRATHPLRHQPPKVVVLSVAGFPEDVVFDLLSSWVNFIYGRHDSLVAEIYRPAAEIMAGGGFEEKRDDILEATEQAGRELVESMKISPETMARIRQPVTDLQSFAQIANLVWKTCIAKSVTPKEMRKKGIIPRPDSMETFMKITELGFNPAGAGDTKAIMQIDFSGEVEGSCHMSIDNGKIKVAGGAAKNPDLTIETPFQVWMDVMTGEADGQQMFMEQKFRAEGDLSLLIRMKELFGKED
jgi:multimeric flavodoxin WrbA/putative sterol carrier protein